LVTSFTDQNIPVCGGSKKIIRTWIVFDVCTEDFLAFAQIIKVNDTTPPKITCPANVSFNTYSNACSAQVWLPQATATDACSSVSVTPSWQFGTGSGPFNTVPVGTHTVTYTAKDACDNVSTCQVTVTVTDVSKPTALCQTTVKVAVQDDGTAIIFAHTFDNGSHDNCGIDRLEVSRDGEPFDGFVHADCNDLAKNVQVTLRVVDKNGLSNQCVSTMKVEDEIPPKILCPPAASLNCGTPYNNPALTGQPYPSDNCGIATTTYSDEANLNYCGSGTVIRTWKATDTKGNQATCQQTITISDNTPVTVVFPADILTYECKPNLDPTVTGQPVVTGKDCEQLAITNTDYYFYTAEPACFKLIRNWAIIDWCVYKPNDPSKVGFWDHTQVIEVRDTFAPVLTCPADLTVGIQNSGCQTAVSVPLPGVDDCSQQVVVTNSAAYAQNSTGAASGSYPKGVHNITYMAADGCGNTSQCAMRLTVVDSQTPSPVCNNGVSVTISQQTGLVTVTPSMINNGSSDNCSPVAKLVLQVSPNTFTCQDLGNKTVTLTVTDESGNSAFCQTTVVVQDNFGVCPSQNTATIAGKLTNEVGDPLPQRLVGLSGGISMAVFTNVDGTYAFPSLPIGNSYTVTPTYNTKLLNGVTTYDMVLIRRHILGVESLNSPYKIIAADVNKSNSVTTLDLVDLQRLILNVSTSFPNGNTSWRFVDAGFVFDDPKKPFAKPFPEAIVLPNLEGNLWNRNFVGIKVGDVNGSASGSNLLGEETGERSFVKSLIFKTKDIELEAGYEYVVPFTVEPESIQDIQSIAGFQFTIDFDENALALHGIEQGALVTLGQSNFAILDAALTVSWENVTDQPVPGGVPVFILKFLAKNSVRLSEALALNSSVTPVEAIGGLFGSPDASYELLGVGLFFEKTVREPLALLQNTPNPFRDRTAVRFQLPEATSVTLRVYNVFGKLLKTLQADYSQGVHRVEIDLGAEPAKGVLFCELEAEDFRRQVIKMMKE
jgi:hypothetical protein